MHSLFVPLAGATKVREHRVAVQIKIICRPWQIQQYAVHHLAL